MQPQGDRSVVISFRLEHLLGWGVTIILCALPLVLWLMLSPVGIRFNNFNNTMLSLGRVTGLIGIVMYALNLFYSTRLRFLENFFGGLNKVYIAHHLLGGLALVFLSFHPVFLALRYIKVSVQTAALLVLPHGLVPISALFNSKAELHSDVLQQWAVFFGIIAFLGMVVLLILTFFWKIPYRIWLFTHKFLGVFFFFAGLHVLFISSDISSGSTIADIMKYYILGISVLGILSYIYRTLMGKIIVRKYRYSVDNVSVVGGNVIELYLSPVGPRMDYKSGQFVFIRFLGTGNDVVSREWHPFSISSGPKDDRLRLSVKSLGDYTKKLLDIRPGAEAEIEGAYGRFTYTHYENKNQIWVAGGIGVTPFLSMARDLDPTLGYKIDLYYSVKTASELIDWSSLGEVANLMRGDFRVFPFISEKQGGVITADFIEKNSGTLVDKDIFICGPPMMMKAMDKQFRKKGALAVNIHREDFAMS